MKYILKNSRWVFGGIGLILFILLLWWWIPYDQYGFSMQSVDRTFDLNYKGFISQKVEVISNDFDRKVTSYYYPDGTLKHRIFKVGSSGEIRSELYMFQGKFVYGACSGWLDGLGYYEPWTKGKPAVFEKPKSMGNKGVKFVLGDPALVQRWREQLIDEGRPVFMEQIDFAD